MYSRRISTNISSVSRPRMAALPGRAIRASLTVNFSVVPSQVPNPWGRWPAHEGLSVLEYFISTHGARKGLADTALRTADSGYLTRRLVDVAQELIVRGEDCESNRGIWVEDVTADAEHLRLLETKLLGRCLAEDVKLADGTTLPRNTEIDEDELRQIAGDPDVNRVRVRSVLTCESLQGVCQYCYGTMLATGSHGRTSARRSASSPPSRSASRARS